MDDIAAALQNLLKDENTMAQVKAMAESMGLTGQNADQKQGQQPQSGGNSPDWSALLSMLGSAVGDSNASNTNTGTGNANTGGAMPDLSALLSMLSSAGSNTDKGSAPPPQSQGSPPIDPQMLTTLMSAMQNLQQEDENTYLLRALKPHLSPKRQPKVDEAIRLMQLFKMLPVLKETGIFNLFGGD